VSTAVLTFPHIGYAITTLLKEMSPTVLKCGFTWRYHQDLPRYFEVIASTSNVRVAGF